MPYRIQYVGNLFVDRLYDHFTKLAVQAKCPNLALLGNIGHPTSPRTGEFLEYCARNWKKVYWVPGPYELGTHFFTKAVATGTFHDNLDRMQTLCERKGISMLHQTTLYDNEVRILGATLWTPCHQGRVADKYSQTEFCTILKTPQAPITPIDIADMNVEDVHWLKQEILVSRVPTVVLTHHLPHPSLLSTAASLQTLKRVGLEVNMLEYLMAPPVGLWLAGSSGSTATTRFQSGTVAAVNSLYEYPMRTRHVKNPGFSPAEGISLGEAASPSSSPFSTTVFYGPRLS